MGDNQSAVTIRVFQGERKIASHNKLLGQFNLEGISSAPRGVPQIEVAFDIDANGILNVSAKDKGTGKEQKITIEASGGLSETEINKMVKDAEENAASDENKKNLAESRNKSESLIHTSEKMIKDHGNEISSEDKEKIDNLSKDLKKEIEGENLDSINHKYDLLNQTYTKIKEGARGQKNANNSAKPESPNE